MKSRVCIRKKWGQPIETVVELYSNGITLTTTLDDFLFALVKEVGNPAMLLTNNGLLLKVQKAAEAAKLELQQASIEVTKQ
jgi:hypothetical protein